MLIRAEAKWEARVRAAEENPALTNMIHVEEARRKKRAEESSEATEHRVAPGAAMPPLGKRARPGRAPVCGTLAEREAKEYGQLLKRYLWALEVAEAPLLGQALESGRAQAVLAGSLGRSRPATIRARLREWCRFARWLGLRGRGWPRNSGDLVSYVHDMVAEGAPKSFPHGFRGAVVWMEARAGFDEGRRYSGDDLFSRTIEWAVKALDDPTNTVQKAARFPLGVLVALELCVADEQELPAVRVLAWTRALKIWGGLRADDAQRITPSDLVLRMGGLAARLLRTKTTGGGKKVRELPMFVPFEATLTNTPRLRVGLELFQQVCGDQAWDFVVPRPRADLRGFLAKPPSASELALLQQHVLTRLRVPHYSAERDTWEFREGGRKLLSPHWARCWTSHSERNTLNSALTAMGVPKDRRDFLGRWSPQGSDEYVRTYRSAVKALVGTFIEHVREKDAFKLLEEDDVVQDAMAKMAGHYAVDVLDREAEDLSLVLQYVCEDLRTVPLTPELGEPGDVPVPPNLPDSEPEPAEDMAAPYILARSKQGRHLCLHKSAGCWKAIGRRFQDWEPYVKGTPDENDDHAVCGLSGCWRRAQGLVETPEEVPEAESTTSSDSTSSSG